MNRRSRTWAAAALLGVVLALGVAAPASAETVTSAAAVEPSAVSPTPPLPPVLPGALGRAAALWSYKLSSMPPSMSDLAKYYPDASQSDALVEYVQTNQDKWLYQRQQAVLAAQRDSMRPDTTEVAVAKAEQAKAWKFPTFAPKQLVRNAVGGAVAGASGLMAYDFGVQAVNGTFKAFGVDVAGTVCGDGGVPMLGVFTGQDCNAYQQHAAAAFQANVDSQAGVSGGLACVSGDTSRCAHYVGVSPNYSPYKCFDYTGPISTSTSEHQQFVVFVNEAGVWGSNAPIARDSAYSIYCGPLSSGDGALAYTTSPIVSYCLVEQFNGTDCGAVPLEHPEMTQANPTRTLQCSVQGDDGNTYTATSAPFTEGDKKVAEANCGALPPGVNPVHAKVVETGGNAPQTVYDQPVNPAYNDLKTKFPECMSGGCTLDLITVTDKVSCFTQGTSCNGWFTDPTRGQKYSCTYGTHDVELERCSVYRQTFDPEMRAGGFAYSNPVTGQIQLTQTAPKGKDAALAAHATVADCMSESVDTGDVWNVIFSPVRCALVWAFVPDPLNTKKAAGDVQDKLNATPIGELGTMLTGWSQAFTVDGCAGPPLDIVVHKGLLNIDYHAHPMTACAGDTLAPFAPPVRIFLSLVIVILGLFSVVNSITSLFNYKKFGGSDNDN